MTERRIIREIHKGTELSDGLWDFPIKPGDRVHAKQRVWVVVNIDEPEKGKPKTVWVRLEK